jgi:hypothetical protein
LVPLIKPGTMSTPRRTQLDLRLSKTGRMRRRQVMADISNLTNSNAVVGATSNAASQLITTYSPTSSAWLKPLNIHQATRSSARSFISSWLGADSCRDRVRI